MDNRVDSGGLVLLFWAMVKSFWHHRLHIEILTDTDFFVLGAVAAFIKSGKKEIV